ncbi:HU family DNA-binding protein [Streptomyces sp. NPDC012888]|uniref:HU family DNA-binding protein n=1 Tax=Streptomyces sp. NPDC012888 TaxID=3364855 RepID=UPI0036BA1D85
MNLPPEANPGKQAPEPARPLTGVHLSEPEPGRPREGSNLMQAAPKTGSPRKGANRALKEPDPGNPRKGVNKAALVEAVALKLGSRQSAVDAVDAVLDAIIRAVVAGDRVSITGFGSFEKVERSPRYGRNPQTGERLRVKKTSAPRFRPGQGFKDLVSGVKKLPKAGEVAVRKTPKGSVASPPDLVENSAKKTAAKKAAAKKTASTIEKSGAKKATARKSAPTAAEPNKKKAPAKKTAGGAG